MVNDESVYCVLFSEQAERVNFISIVRHCFQNRIFSYNLSRTILAVVAVVAAVRQFFTVHTFTQFISPPMQFSSQGNILAVRCLTFYTRVLQLVSFGGICVSQFDSYLHQTLVTLVQIAMNFG